MYQYSSAEQEESKTFVITGVVDTSSNDTVSLDEAVQMGIINQDNGTFYNRAKRKTCPISTAMNDRLIKVELVTTKKSKETTKDMGLIAIRNETKSRPYKVTGVVDVKTRELVTISRAFKRGLLDPEKGTFMNSLTGENMPLDDALVGGLVVVEVDEDEDVIDDEEVVTYGIYKVVNQKRKENVKFSEAVRSGLINLETGAYYHNVSHEYIFIGEAIKKGFVKASIVEDTSNVEIYTENQFVLDKLSNVRKKIMNPMKAIAALRGVVVEKRQLSNK